MPRVNISIQTAGGQTIVLTEGDKLIKEVIIECNSQRCASRHGQDKPQEVALIDGQPMPEAGIQWMSLILPETSPQYTPMPPNFCSPTCVRDFLVYQYLAPASSQKGDCIPEKDLTNERRASLGLVRKTDSEPVFQHARVIEFDPDKPAGFIPTREISHEELLERYPSPAEPPIPPADLEKAFAYATSKLIEPLTMTDIEASVGSHDLPVHDEACRIRLSMDGVSDDTGMDGCTCEARTRQATVSQADGSGE